MIYIHKDSKLELEYGKGSLYHKGRLLFRGDGYIAIKMFIDKSENHPEVIEKFRPQLNSREEVRWKKRDEELRQKKKLEEPPSEPPKKEKVIRRPKNNKINNMFKTVR